MIVVEVEYILFEDLVLPALPPPLPGLVSLQASFQPVSAIVSARIPTAFAFSELAWPVCMRQIKIDYCYYNFLR